MTNKTDAILTGLSLLTILSLILSLILGFTELRLFHIIVSWVCIGSFILFYALLFIYLKRSEK